MVVRGVSPGDQVSIRLTVDAGARMELQGWAVQVDPMKPTLKGPGTNRSKPRYDEQLSILLQFCFQIQLVPLHQGGSLSLQGAALTWRRTELDDTQTASMVGRCRLTLSNPG